MKIKNDLCNCKPTPYTVEASKSAGWAQRNSSIRGKRGSLLNAPKGFNLRRAVKFDTLRPSSS
jgi:hypothetical protein